MLQICQWEQNLERLSVDLFRFKCYVSSLQGLELPNPKGLLSVASRSSKCMLGRLGVFTVSSLHALVRTNHSFLTMIQRIFFGFFCLMPSHTTRH